MSSRLHCLRSCALAPALLTLALGASAQASGPQVCAEPYRVSREEVLQAMRSHGDYSLTSTTTSMRFGAEALLELVRRRQAEAPGSTRLFVAQADWFAAHLETAGVTYDEMSAGARAAFEHHQDAVVEPVPLTPLGPPDPHDPRVRRQHGPLGARRRAFPRPRPRRDHEGPAHPAIGPRRADPAGNLDAPPVDEPSAQPSLPPVQKGGRRPGPEEDTDHQQLDASHTRIQTARTRNIQSSPKAVVRRP